MKWIYVVTWMVIQATGPGNQKSLTQKQMTRTFSTRDSAYNFMKVGMAASKSLTFKIDSTRKK